MKKTEEQTVASALVARRAAVVTPGVAQFAGNATALRASGGRIVDADGEEWIDLAAGIGVMNVGHCHPKVVAAIQKQAAELLHACIHVATYEPYVALCEKLVSILPHGRSKGEGTKAMLVNSGAEAVENAIKIARQATGRSAVVCYTGAFHGRTSLCMTLTSKVGYKLHCGPPAAETYRLPFPNHFRYGGGRNEAEYIARELQRLEEAFVQTVSHEDIAAVIIEPVQGEGGFVVAPAAYLQGLRRICDERGIMLICDEVQSGFCRTGRWSAYEYSGIVPDLSTWAKSLGGGMPIAAVLGRAEVMDKASPGTLGGTFGGNPVACAAALAALEVMETEGLAKRALKIGTAVRERFGALKERYSFIADVRGIGAMMAVEFCHDRDLQRPATDVVASVLAAARAERVLALPAGATASIIRILAPLTIADADLARGLDVLEAGILSAASKKTS